MSGMSRARLMWTALAGLLLCAGLSWFKGQDTNWDQLNYHRYIAWAFFHHRLGLDLAPAGLQSYFNPGLDLPLYWLNEHLPGPWVGVIVGGWHGLVFVFTLLIAREVWPFESGKGLLLSVLAGVLAPVFWAGLGNSMGDNAAAVLMLAALYGLLRFVRTAWEDGRAPVWRWVALSGFLLGACVALKLTNAPPAIAMGVALLLHLPSWRHVWLVLGLIVPAGLLGFALGGGWWFYEVWRQFGNPFFPQFSNLFPSPLTERMSIMDQRFIPDNLGSLLLRPVLMLVEYRITSEFFVLPLLWPLWFMLGLLALWHLARERLGQTPMGKRWSVAQRFVLIFVLLGVVLWARLFGIYRYTAALEPLLPLCMSLVLWRIGQSGWHPWVKRGLVLSMVCTVCGGAVNWGHTGWAERSFRSDGEVALAGSKPLLLVVGNGNSWIVPFMGTRATFASVGAYAHFGRGYDSEITRRARDADKVYALVGMSQNWRYDVVDKANEVLSSVGFLDDPHRCDWIAKLIARSKPHAGFMRCDGGACHQQCMLTKLPADQAEVERRDMESIRNAQAVLQPYGLAFSEAQCVVKGAFIGQKRYPFRLCELNAVSGRP